MADRIIKLLEPCDFKDKRYHVDKNFLKDPRRFGDITLYQIGRLYCGAKTKIGTHVHNGAYEITVVTAGKGTVYANGNGIPVQRGDIFLSMTHDFHAIEADTADPLKYDFFAFATDNAELSKALSAIEESFSASSRRVIRDENISMLVRSAISEFDRQDEFSETVLNSLFLQIIVYLIRGFGDVSHLSKNSGVTNAEALCYQIMNYIDTHIYELKDLSGLSSVTNYSYSYLSSLFCKVTGETLSDYFRNRRLETARILIEEDKKSITAAAEMVGYSSIYTFSRAFKMKYGVSPASYKKQ